MNDFFRFCCLFALLLRGGLDLRAQGGCQKARILSEMKLAEEDYEASLAYAQEACRICEKEYGRSHRETAKAYLAVSKVYSWLEQHKNAYPFFQQAKTISDSLPPEKDTFSVELLILLGGCLSKVGRHTEALRILRQAYAQAVELFGEQSYYAGQAANQLGVTCGRLGMEEESDLYFNLSMEIDRANMKADSIGYYISLVNIADVEMNRGNYFKARVLVAEALEGLANHSAAGKKSALYGQVLIYASGIEYQLGDLEGAEKTIREALNIIEATLTNDSDPYIQALIILGVIYDDQKKHKQAIETALDALERFPRVYQQPDTIAKLTIQSNLCIYYERDSQLIQALRCNQEVLAEKQRFLGTQHPNYILSLRNKATFHFKAGEYAQADSLYTLALQAYREIADSLNFNFLDALHDAGWLKEAMGQTSAAHALYREMYSGFNLKLSRNIGFLSEQQKERYLKHNLKFPNTFFSFVAKGYQQDSLLLGLAYDQVLHWKGLIFSSQKQMLNSIEALNDTLVSSLYVAWKADKLELSNQISLSKSNQTLNTDSLAQEIETKEATLALKSNRFQQTLQAISWRDVQARLGPGEAAIEFHHFRYKGTGKDWTDSTRYVALVLRPGWAQPRFIPLCSATQLQQALDTRDIKPWQAKLEKLYGEKGRLFPLIWQPLDSLLAGVQKIWYSPSGLLHNVAFAALQKPDRQYLLTQYRLERMTSTRELALQAPGQEDFQPGSALLYGGIRYDSAAIAVAVAEQRDIAEEISIKEDSTLFRGFHLLYLPYTSLEVRELYSLLTRRGIAVDTLTGFSATEAALRLASTAAKAPGIIHIATHGFTFFACQSGKCDSIPGWRSSLNPLFRSGLALAGANKAGRKKSGSATTGDNDGLLFAYDIADMNLQNTRLAVLSACGTALGEIQGSEGVYGLQRAFKMAGVEHLIVSLWSVPDQYTKDFMLLFYQNWLINQLPLREAFAKTQHDAMDTIPFSVWAAFVLM